MDIYDEYCKVRAKSRYLEAVIKELQSYMTILGIDYTSPSAGGKYGSVVESAVFKLIEKYEEFVELKLKESDIEMKLLIMINDLPKDIMINFLTYDLIENLPPDVVCEKINKSPRSYQRLKMQTRQILKDWSSDPTYMKAVDIAYRENRNVRDVLREDFNYG